MQRISWTRFKRYRRKSICQHLTIIFDFVCERLDMHRKDLKQRWTKKKYILELTDVGGQRSERKKWLHLDTSKIDAVLYIMAVSEYDMMLYEDRKVKRYDEAYDLFVDVLEKGFMQGKTCLIFFNKYDLFLEKLKTLPVTNFCPDYPGDSDPQNPESVCNWLFTKYKTTFDKHVTSKTPALHFHCTTALDTDLVQKLLKHIQKDVLSKRFAMAGYL